MTAVSGLATRPLYDSTDSLLRFAIRVDATITGLAGLIVAAAADQISSLTGLSSAEEYGLGAATASADRRSRYPIRRPWR